MLKAIAVCRHVETDNTAVETAPRTFLLDLNYAMPPSPKVDKAWSSLLPERGGFFTHPNIAPKESCLAVFHQIHCLDMLRRALYETRPDIMNQGKNKSSTASSDHRRREKTTENNEAHDMYHLGHCFDLLRQAIMCKPVGFRHRRQSLSKWENSS